MPKMFVILFGMELEPEPFFSRGNIDEIIYALYHGPVIWQIQDSVMMVEIETQGLGFLVDLRSSTFISRPSAFKLLAFHDFAP